VLLSTGATVTDSAMLVYRLPGSSEKDEIAKKVTEALKGTWSDKGFQSVTIHSDKHTLSLIRVRKPSDDSIVDVHECELDYVAMREKQLIGNQEQDDILKRAQVYHILPNELEAWYIERWSRRKEGAFTLPPRIVRLLEDPAMAQAFFRCLMTGAVYRNEEGQWRWLSPSSGGKEVWLTEKESQEPHRDLLRAAEIFCLQQQDCREGIAGAITVERAVESFRKADQNNIPLASWRSGQDVLRDKVKGFMDDYFTEPDTENKQAQKEYKDLLHGLGLLFRFYGDARNDVGLRNRVELPAVN
jgi:hypothetical protein